jgi:hypothetical protein
MIKLLTTMSGPDGVFHPGRHTFDAATEQALIKAGCAEPVTVPVKRQAETALARPGENTAQPHTARRQRKE